MMKVKYFYDGQVRRVLKHLIRLFGEFQVSTGFDPVTGKQKFKGVPCRYADVSRMTAYALTGGSENTTMTYPSININIQSLNIDKPNMTAPVSGSTIVGINKSTGPNEYTEELSEIHHVRRYNPVPWKLVFNVNICTTSTTNKLELFEQISTVFNPSVQLQLNENPLDWASVSNVELTDCTFSTRQFPQGQDSSDIDVMILTFETTIWMSLPATVERAKLIEQIVTNINTTRDELDIELGIGGDISTDVFTPRNMCIKVEKIVSRDANEQYEVTLVGKNMSEVTTNNRIYSWDAYLSYLKPTYKDGIVGIKFQDEIEDPNPIVSTVIRYEDEPNKLIVQVDTSKYSIAKTIKTFVDNSKFDFSKSSPTDNYINISGNSLKIGDSTIPNNALFSLNNNVAVVTNPELIDGYVYCSSDNSFYKFDELLGWHQAVLTNYRQGFWRLTFKD